jgi:hypothetical protein
LWRVCLLALWTSHFHFGAFMARHLSLALQTCFERCYWTEQGTSIQKLRSSAKDSSTTQPPPQHQPLEAIAISGNKPILILK